MKAFLLAAGLGTRLLPLTEKIPKCLLPINGKPLLGYWLELFSQHGIEEVLINTHYLADQVCAYLSGAAVKQKVRITLESELLGSAGTVAANYDFIRNEADFLICYADNLTNANLSQMVAFHRSKSALLTCALFSPANLEECGVVSINQDGLITDFEEKPAKPKSKWANAGIFIAAKELINYIPVKKPCDFGFDVLPRLVQRAYGFILEDYLIDIGTLASYAKAQAEWVKIEKKSMRGDHDH